METTKGEEVRVHRWEQLRSRSPTFNSLENNMRRSQSLRIPMPQVKFLNGSDRTKPRQSQMHYSYFSGKAVRLKTLGSPARAFGTSWVTHSLV